MAVLPPHNPDSPIMSVSASQGSIAHYTFEFRLPRTKTETAELLRGLELVRMLCDLPNKWKEEGNND